MFCNCTNSTKEKRKSKSEASFQVWNSERESGSLTATRLFSIPYSFFFYTHTQFLLSISFQFRYIFGRLIHSISFVDLFAFDSTNGREVFRVSICSSSPTQILSLYFCPNFMFILFTTNFTQT